MKCFSKSEHGILYSAVIFEATQQVIGKIPKSKVAACFSGINPLLHPKQYGDKILLMSFLQARCLLVATMRPILQNVMVGLMMVIVQDLTRRGCGKTVAILARQVLLLLVKNMHVLNQKKGEGFETEYFRNFLYTALAANDQILSIFETIFIIDYYCQQI